jgi:hypothetical protein
MKTEIESLQSYVALSFIIIGILVRFSPAYLNISFHHGELVFHTISYAFFFLGAPIVIYQLTNYNRRITLFFSSASILWLSAMYLQFEILKIINVALLALFVKIIIMILFFLGLIILFAGIGYKRGLKKK